MYRINFRNGIYFCFPLICNESIILLTISPVETECSGFHPWIHKRAISFSFNLMNPIALCQFCKLDRCVQLKEEIKGKVVGPESFGYDRVNSSQRTVLTSVAARAQPKPVTTLDRGSQELRGTPTLAMLSPMRCCPTGSEHSRQRQVLVRRPIYSPRHSANQARGPATERC